MFFSLLVQNLFFGCIVNGNLSSYLHSMRLMLHDLAQPLSVMVGAVDLLMIESDPESREFEDIRYINDQLQVIVDKINDIRQLAQQLNVSAETPEKASGIS
jgi:signal transduction histidine kinase